MNGKRTFAYTGLHFPPLPTLTTLSPNNATNNQRFTALSLLLKYCTSHVLTVPSTNLPDPPSHLPELMIHILLLYSLPEPLSDQTNGGLTMNLTLSSSFPPRTLLQIALL